MDIRTGILAGILLAAGSVMFGQQTTQPTPQSQPAQAQPKSAGSDIGNGTGDVGKGAAKGAGNLASGTGKGAADVVTLHPVEGAGAIGKGGVDAGKNVGEGTAKGTGKVAKGTGKLVAKPFSHKKTTDTTTDPQPK